MAGYDGKRAWGLASAGGVSRAAPQAALLLCVVAVVALAFAVAEALRDGVAVAASCCCGAVAAQTVLPTAMLARLGVVLPLTRYLVLAEMCMVIEVPSCCFSVIRVGGFGLGPCPRRGLAWTTTMVRAVKLVSEASPGTLDLRRAHRKTSDPATAAPPTLYLVGSVERDDLGLCGGVASFDRQQAAQDGLHLAADLGDRDR